MAHPLALSYNWRTPVTVSTVAVILCVGLLVHSRADGWGAVVAAIIVIWLLFIGIVWLRTRAFLMVDGPILTVRRYRAKHQLDGRQLESVREYFTGSGPSYTVRLRDDPTRYFVPTALISRGHSTFFDWVLRYAPGATLDTRSQRTIDQLRTRGLLQ